MPLDGISQEPVREPRLLSFNLRSLLYFFALAAATFALLTNIGQAWQLLVVSAIGLVAAHVLGTMIGTRLRDTSKEIQRWKTSGPNALADHPLTTPQPFRVAELHLPARTPLAFSQPGHERGHLPTVVGAALGILVGLGGIYALAGPQVTLAGWALGSVSCGVMGAWAAMLGVNFWTIARHAIRQAAAGDGERRG